MYITYCNEKCDIGAKAREQFLANNNSAYDAVIDFLHFEAQCRNTCPYKEIRDKFESEVNQCCGVFYFQ